MHAQSCLCIRATTFASCATAASLFAGTRADEPCRSGCHLPQEGKKCVSQSVQVFAVSFTLLSACMLVCPKGHLTAQSRSITSSLVDKPLRRTIMKACHLCRLELVAIGCQQIWP